MGRSIVYCDKCGKLLKEEDFSHGKASSADNRSFCSECRPLVPPPVSSSSTSLRLPSSKVSSSRIPKQPTQRIATPAAPVPAGAPPPPKSPVAIYAGVGALVLVIGLVAVMSGGKRTVDSAPTTVVTTTVPPVRPSLPGPERVREEAAKEACVKAYAVKQMRPQDLAGQWKAFQAAVDASQGTSYAEDAGAQMSLLRRKLADERGALEGGVTELVAKEQFKSAIELLESSLKRYDLSEWTQPTGAKLAEIRAELERRFSQVKDAATEAKKRGGDAEVRRFRDQVAAWNVAGFPEQFDRTLAEVKIDAPPPDADAAAKAAAEKAAKWAAAVAPACARDYPEAIKALEALGAKDDAETLKLAATVFPEGLALLAKLQKGQKLAISYYGPDGALARIDDTLLKIDATRLEMKKGDEAVLIPFGEVSALTLGELFKARPAKKDSDARAVAAACALEGIPDLTFEARFDAAGRAAAEARLKDDRERAARSTFYQADRDYFQSVGWLDAVAKFKSLLGESASTAFVKRNRAAIAARTEGPKDFYFDAPDLHGSTGFKSVKHAKLESIWVSQADVDTAKTKDNFVVFQFDAATDLEYRAWIYAGGCCQEVFTCWFQGTELTGPDPANPREKMPVEPGSAAGAAVKLPFSSMKKLHSQHTGPKSPEKFEWLTLGAFKFPTAGRKEIRILTNQKGFGVAQAALLSSKPGPPRELDFREAQKLRAETPGASLPPLTPPSGQILREAWKGIDGGSIGDLLNAQAYKDDKPTDTAMLTSFEGPTEWSDNYGSRIRGYVHPPVSGAYVFWVASDDQGELWLSSDDDPAHKQRIASTPEWVGVREYTKFPTQKSGTIELKAGRRYYIEALQKDGVGGDHLSVGWTMPGGVDEKPIPGNRLSPFVRR